MSKTETAMRDIVMIHSTGLMLVATCAVEGHNSICKLVVVIANCPP